MEALILIPALIYAFVIHEFAHAWQAKREGDDTAEKAGRITLNPIPHLDFFGSFLVPAFLYLSGTSFLFGWAKPVMVNPANYRNYVAGDIRVSLAGIVANLLSAVAATLLMAIVAKVGAGATGTAGAVVDVVYFGLNYLLVINLILAFFNLIPIPPLDGSHVVGHMLPPSLQVKYRSFGQYGIVALIAIMYLGRSVGFDLFAVILWPVNFCRGLADLFIRLWI